MDDGVRELIDRLEKGAHRTRDRLAGIPADHLGKSSRHNCARGGTVWDLLTHNTEHDTAHAGQVVGVRDQMRRLRQDPLTRLQVDLYVARTALVASLFGLTDQDLDREPPDGGWTVRQIVEHVLFWEEDSMADLVAEHGGSTVARSCSP